MAKFSTGLRNYSLATGSIKQALANSEIRLFSGTPPAHADSALSGDSVLLCVLIGDVGRFNFDATAADGILTKEPTLVIQGEILATGVPTFYRHVQAADTDGYSNAHVRIQGSVGLVGTDMELSNTSLVQGGMQRLSSHSVVLTEE